MRHLPEKALALVVAAVAVLAPGVMILPARLILDDNVFEGGTGQSIDTALEFAIAPISPQIAVTSFSKGLKVGPIAAMFYANEIRLNYEQYAGNSDNIAIANGIDTAVLVAGVVVGALLAKSALPVVAIALIAVGAGVLISVSADRIEDALIE